MTYMKPDLHWMAPAYKSSSRLISKDRKFYIFVLGTDHIRSQSSDLWTIMWIDVVTSNRIWHAGMRKVGRGLPVGWSNDIDDDVTWQAAHARTSSALYMAWRHCTCRPGQYIDLIYISSEQGSPLPPFCYICQITFAAITFAAFSHSAVFSYGTGVVILFLFLFVHLDRCTYIFIEPGHEVWREEVVGSPIAWFLSIVHLERTTRRDRASQIDRPVTTDVMILYTFYTLSFEVYHILFLSSIDLLSAGRHGVLIGQSIGRLIFYHIFYPVGHGMA